MLFFVRLHQLRKFLNDESMNREEKMFKMLGVKTSQNAK